MTSPQISLRELREREGEVVDGGWWTLLRESEVLALVEAVEAAGGDFLDDVLALLDLHTSPEVMKETRLRVIDRATILVPALARFKDYGETV